MSDDDQKIVALLHVREKVRLDLDRLMDSVPDLKGVELRLTPLRRRGGRTLASIGDGCLTYRVSGLMMRCHLSAFSQVNLGRTSGLSIRFSTMPIPVMATRWLTSSAAPGT